MADNVIGRVYVRVSPDTSTFRDEAKVKLDKVEKQLPTVEAKVEVALDDASEALVEAEVKALRDEVQRSVGAIRLRVDLDNANSIQEALSKIDQELASLGDVKIPVQLDRESLTAAKELLQEALGDAHFRIEYDNDLPGVKKALAQVQAELEKFKPKATMSVEYSEANLKEAEALLQARLDQFNAEVQVQAELKQQALAEVEAELKALAAHNVQVEIDLDNERWLAETRAATNEAQRIVAEAKMALPLGAKVDKARVDAALSEISTLVRKRNDLMAQLGLELSARSAEKIALEIEATEKAIQKAVGSIKVPVELDAKPSKDTEAVLGALARSSFSKVLDVTSVLSGWHALQESITDAHQMFISMFTELPKLATMTTLLLGAAGAALSLSGNIIGIAGSLVQLVPLLAAIPGLIIGLGATALAFKDFGTELPDVTAKLKGLQSVISGAFWAAAQKQVAAFANSFLTILTPAVKNLGTVLGDFFGQLSASFQSILNPALPGMFAGLASSISIFTSPAITNALAQIVTFLGQLSAAILPPLATLMGQVAERFAAWVQGADISGIASTAVSTFKDLLNTVVGFGQVLYQVWTAARDAGAATLLSFSTGILGFAKLLAQPEIHDALAGLFQAGFDMMQNFTAAAGPAFSSIVKTVSAGLSGILPVVGSILGTVAQDLNSLISPQLMQGLSAFIQGISLGFEQLTPTFSVLGNFLGSLGPVLGTLAQTIGGVFAALSPTFDSVLAAVSPLITLLGGTLMQALKPISDMIGGLAPAISEFVNSGVSALAGVFAGLLPVVQQLVPILGSVLATALKTVGSVMETLGPIIGQIVAALGPILGAALQALVPILQVLLPPIQQLATMLGQLLVQALNALAPIFPPLVQAIEAILQAVVPLIPMLLQLVISVITPLLPLVTQLVTAVLPILVTAVDLVSTALQVLLPIIEVLVSTLLPPLAAVLTVVAGILATVLQAALQLVIAGFNGIVAGIAVVQDGIQGFADWWQGIWTTVTTFFQKIWTDIINWIKDFLGIHSPSKVFMDIAQNLVDGLINGLTGAWGAVEAFFTGAWNWVKNTATSTISAVAGFFGGLWGKVTGAIGDLAGNVRSFFSNAFNKMQDGATAAWGTFKGWLSGLGHMVISGIGNLGSLLLQAGKDLIQGFINGIKSMAGSIISAIASTITDHLPGFVKDALGIHSPSTVFFEIGKNVMLGLAKGITDSSRYVTAAIKSVSADVSGFSVSGIGIGALGVSPAMYQSPTPNANGGNTFNYYAAPNNSLSSEDDLFAALSRGRAFGW